MSAGHNHIKTSSLQTKGKTQEYVYTRCMTYYPNHRQIIVSKPPDDPTEPAPYTPEEEEPEPPQYTEAQTRAGFRYSAYAASCAAALLIPGLSLPAIFLGTFFIRRARLNGNPAIVGTIVRFLNIVETIILLIALAIAVIGGVLWYQDLERSQQQQQSSYSTMTPTNSFTPATEPAPAGH